MGRDDERQRRYFTFLATSCTHCSSADRARLHCDGGIQLCFSCSLAIHQPQCSSASISVFKILERIRYTRILEEGQWVWQGKEREKIEDQ